ncbi:MAG: Ig-like domain-containing protein [Verrucomicrobiae bacterium]|nr:Ig-like domain-containing protein [Verrucomicrobiae bacterium]
MKNIFKSAWWVLAIGVISIVIFHITVNIKEKQTLTETRNTQSPVQNLPDTKAQNISNPLHNRTTPAKEDAVLMFPQSPQNYKSNEQPFKEFSEWVIKYRNADNKSKQTIEQEGVELAKKRLHHMARLIVRDPQRALELAMPQSLKTELPPSIQNYIEEHLNTRADYQVLCVLPIDGQNKHLSLVRTAEVNGEKYQVFTYGKALEYITRQNVPINGIAVPADFADNLPPDNIGLNPTKVMALSPAPARLLSTEEAKLRGVTAPIAIEIGGEAFAFQTMAQALEWAEQRISDESLDTPPVPTNLDTAESSYTEGRKRFLLMRVDFPDYQVEALTTNGALTLMNDFSNFMAQVSYSKFIIAPVGQGSDITPVMRMSTNAAAYDNAGLSKLYPEAQQKARDVYGYDLNKYDFFFVVTGSKPAYTYAGLGYVGGVGFHLANSYFDVRTTAHEFGHNLGLGHANWWNTGDKSMIGDGENEEYGDPFDTMGGSGGGKRHFSSWNKNRINWISNSDCPTVTTSGVYRLFAHDIVQAPAGIRGLRINRPSGNPYWLEFRQLWTDNTALMNGISLRWVSGSTILFDTTPGSSGGKDDHPLTIGRTFADPSMNLYITPLRKAKTYPESLDIAINFGPFPTNVPPEIFLSASTRTASVNQTITFSVEAKDTNGDTLAYFWDFGDGSYSTENAPVVAKSFSSAGKYRIYCAVSDTKGGVAAETITVQVGNPSTYTISGRVLTTDGKPVTGIKVYIDSSKYGFSGTDGSYTIGNISAGTYTLNAMEPIFGTNTFIAPSAVTVGPDYSGADFFMIPASSNLYVSLISKGSVWKYLDDGSDQGTNWISSNFDDSGWSNGAAILGYGEGNETTVIRYGTNSSNKHITYYFRHKFNVTSQTLSSFTNLLLEVLRDDGVIVYINGAEVFRDNMPSGMVNYKTLASSTVEPTAYLQTNLPTSVLHIGTNTVAVEIHQSVADSSDANFDLALSGVSLAGVTNIRAVYIDTPKNNQVFYNPSSITITAQAKSGSTPVTGVAFFVDGSLLSQDMSAPYQATWNNPSLGKHTLTAVAVISGVSYTSAPVKVEIAAPIVVPQPVQITLIPQGAIWYYLATNNDAPANWYQFSYDHSRWQSGPAELGYGENDEATRVSYGSDSNNKWITTYFRRYFTVNDPMAITNLTLNLKRDDGAIVYINGVEVVRDLLPEGTVTWSTLAENAPDDGQNFNPFTINPSTLIHGTNLIAVEIHQSSASSSDLSFDISLVALATTNRNRGVWITSPTNNAEFSSLAVVHVSAEAVAGQNLGILKTDFYSGNTLIGTATPPDFFIDWQKPLPGMHQIIAVATDSIGGSITSAPVVVNIKSPPVVNALISFGESWKFLDNGTDQGTTWRSLNFDDRRWRSGAGKFGYGNDGERTVVNWGTNSSARYITTYFRKQFYVANSTALSSLLLNIIRDDGVVVYINGKEVFRDNLLDGMVSFNSLALRTLGGSEELTPIQAQIPATYISAGTNIIAVEVHQANISSSDLGFDLELLGITETNLTNGIYISSPYNGAKITVNTPVEINSVAIAGGSYVQRVTYYINNVRVGDTYTAPFRFDWTPTSKGAYTIRAQAFFGSGQSIVSIPISITAVEPQDLVEPVHHVLIPAMSDWKYWDYSSAPPAGWQNIVYNETNWLSGYARFGYGLDGEKTIITEGRITHYFRKAFYITNIAMFNELEFRLQRDDGAVVYLNGREIFRSNMPSGSIGHTTTANSTVDTPDETAWFTTVVAARESGLINGTNVVAVELHQSSSTSSDAGFDLELLAYGDTADKIMIYSPASGSVYSITNTVNVRAAVWTPSSPTQKTEFYVNGTKLAETSGSNDASFIWNTLLPGTHTVAVRAITAYGKIVDSEPITIIVGQNSLHVQLISSNSVWKYLDDGSDQGTAWRWGWFDDSSWKSAQARLGYGDDGEVTKLNFGTNSNNKYITYYFRKTLTVPDGVVITNLTFYLLRDDGAVVYLDGTEQFRSNMPSGDVNYQTLASAAVSGTAEQTYYQTQVSVTLTPGIHLVAVEIHQNSASSSDLAFDLAIEGAGFVQVLPNVATEIRREGKYLRLSAPSIYGDWRVVGYTNINHIPNGGFNVPFTVIESNSQKHYLIEINNEPNLFLRLVKP